MRGIFIANEKGVALITALLVAVLVSVIGITMLDRQQIDIRRAANILHRDQSFWLARSLEAKAALLLANDSNLVSHPGEEWAQRFTLSANLQTSKLSGQIVDLQGRFNVNNLVVNDSVKHNFYMEQLGRILEFCEMEGALKQPIKDWIDEDQEYTFPNGAEDEVYESLEEPYLTANQMMVSVTELQMVSAENLHIDDTGNLDKAGFDCLAKHVCALPDSSIQVNVNTATAEVLASVSRVLTVDEAQELIDDRPEETGYLSIDEFLLHPVLGGTKVFDKKDYLTVDSSYFLARSEAITGRGRTVLFSMLKKKNSEKAKDKVSVIRRGIGVL